MWRTQHVFSRLLLLLPVAWLILVNRFPQGISSLPVANVPALHVIQQTSFTLTLAATSSQYQTTENIRDTSSSDLATNVFICKLS